MGGDNKWLVKYVGFPLNLELSEDSCGMFDSELWTLCEDRECQWSGRCLYEYSLEVYFKWLKAWEDIFWCLHDMFKCLRTGVFKSSVWCVK
jgi:hypothetical protein